jgi:hypothetical protein
MIVPSRLDIEDDQGEVVLEGIAFSDYLSIPLRLDSPIFRE